MTGKASSIPGTRTPQPGIYALGTASHAYLELDASAGRGGRELVGEIASLREPRTTMGGVNLVAGFTPELWAAVAPDDAPAAKGFDSDLVGVDGFVMPATQHDAVLWLSGSAYDVVFDVARAVIRLLAGLATVAEETSSWPYRHTAVRQIGITSLEPLTDTGPPGGLRRRRSDGARSVARPGGGRDPVGTARGSRDRAAPRRPRAARPFRYRDLGSLAAVSRYYAIGERRRARVWGFAGWLFWLFVHLGFLTGFKNRIGARVPDGAISANGLKWWATVAP